MDFEKLHNAMVDRINKLDHAYWVDLKPLVGDPEYDKEMKSLIDFETKHPEIDTANSPTQRLGGGLLKGFATREHIEPMLSLDNLFSSSDLEQKIKGWLSTLGVQGAPFIIEPKIDGLSCDLKYQRGNLVQALTRGNGREGDDVTANVRTIRSVPLFIEELDKDEDIHIRGEVCMTFDDFKLVNERQAKLGLAIFKNPRNAAAGTLRSLDSKEVSQRRLSFIPYHVINNVNTMVPVYQDQLHDWFKDLGFKSIHWYEVGVTIDEVVDWVMKFEALRTRMPFPVDGAVIKLNFRPDWKNFPNATKSARWGYAYKYAPEEAETVLKGITVQVGRTGALAPVAELEPVEVSGSTIERATLHNFDEIEKLGVYPGCRVIIAKAGEVIPMCCKVVEFVYICPICKFKGTEKEQMEHHSDVRIKMD